MAQGQGTGQETGVDELIVRITEDLTPRVQKVLPQPATQGPRGERWDPAVAVSDLARVIDHTLLKADATEDQVRRLCAEARAYGFAAVCVNPTWVPLCRDLLADSEVRVCTVVGFPLGATLPKVKAFEAEAALEAGAQEIDMVLQVGRLKSRQYEYVAEDIAAVVQAVHPRGGLVKVIIEAAALTLEEKIAACVLAKLAAADYVKTSTGFGPGGATVDDVTLMRRVVGPEMGVKAAGGIRTAAAARQMIAAGATRIGTSTGVQIVNEAQNTPAEGGDKHEADRGKPVAY